jgi:hypothetical protein
MRRSWLCVPLALVLMLATAVPAAAGGRKSITLTDPGVRTDCTFFIDLAWANYGTKAYTLHVIVLYDGNPIPHPAIPGINVFDWTESVTGTDVWRMQIGLTGTGPTMHTVTYDVTLSSTGNHPRVVAAASLEQTTYCLATAD